MFGVSSSPMASLGIGLGRVDGSSMRTVKVALVGAAGVGKTAFIKQVCEGTFAKEYAPTDQFQISECTLEDPGGSEATLRAQFWDAGSVAGAQKRDKLLADSFAVIIMYDVTNYKSFREATTTLYNEVLTRAPGAFVMLVGCKTDLVADRVINVKEAERFANRQNMFFMEVSASDGTNVQLVVTILRIRAAHAISLNQSSLDMQDDDEPLDVGSVTSGVAQHSEPFVPPTVEQPISEAAAMAEVGVVDPRFSLAPVSKSYDTIASILGRTPTALPSASPSSIQELASRLLQMSTAPSPFKSAGTGTSTSFGAGAPAGAGDMSMASVPMDTGDFHGGQGMISYVSMSDTSSVSEPSLADVTGLSASPQRSPGMSHGHSESSPLASSPKSPRTMPTQIPLPSASVSSRYEALKQQLEQVVSIPEPTPVASISLSQLFGSSQGGAAAYVAPSAIPAPSSSSAPRSNGGVSVGKASISFSSADVTVSKASVAGKSAAPPPAPAPTRRATNGTATKPAAATDAAKTAKAARPTITRIGTSITFRPAAEGTAAPLPVKRASAPAGEPLLYIEVNVGGGKMGQIEVRQGDNAYQLASKFVADAGMDNPKFVRKLARLIQSRVNDFCESEVQRQREERQQRVKKQADQWRRRITTCVPFSFTSDTRVGDARKKEEKPLIGRLHIEVGQGKEGVINIRVDDDPNQLVQSFLLTYGVQPDSDFAQQLLSQIEQHIAAAKAAVVAQLDSPKPAAPPAPPAGAARNRKSTGDAPPSYARLTESQKTRLSLAAPPRRSNPSTPAAQPQTPIAPPPVPAQAPAPAPASTFVPPPVSTGIPTFGAPQYSSVPTTPAFGPTPPAQAPTGWPGAASGTASWAAPTSAQFGQPQQSFAFPSSGESTRQSFTGGWGMETETFQGTPGFSPTFGGNTPGSSGALTGAQLALLQRTLSVAANVGAAAPAPAPARGSDAWGGGMPGSDGRDGWGAAPMSVQEVDSPIMAGGYAAASMLSPPLFNLDIDIGNGVMKRIAVHRGDNMQELAQSFVAQNDLPPAAVGRVQKLLQQNLKLHHERKTQREFR